MSHLPKIWLTCPVCRAATADAILTTTEQHVKARCPTCGSHIKFISKSNFSIRELAQLRGEKVIETDIKRCVNHEQK